MEKGVLRVSVRSLVEYSLRRGSLGYQYQTAGASRAQEGSLLHRKIQKKRAAEAMSGGWSYEREVSFSRIIEAGGTEITVRGRADGILKKDGKVYIEEIKTTETPYEDISGNELHVAQAKCYAYFYLLENDEREIYVLLTYMNAQTYEIKEFEYELCFDELKSFFEYILDTYVKWARFIIQCKNDRDLSIASTPFPYESYRKRQREMCVLVYRSIEGKKPIFISAPTGTGKTISTLFPAVKALPGGKADKIFYLTAKTVTQKAALDAVALMERKGLIAKTAVITAKDKACFMEKAVCDAASCPHANGHFDRINTALYDILKNENIMSAGVISRYAVKHTVCPYEYSLDIAVYSDIVICDYNYAFDPRAYLRRFFSETSENYVFLIDEAHNLVDRAREMYTAALRLTEIKASERRIGKKAGSLKRLIKSIADEISELSQNITESDYGVTFDAPPKPILSIIRDYCRTADRWLQENGRGKRLSYYDDVLEQYFNLNHFLAIAEVFDQNFVCCCERERNETMLKLFCVNPSAQMEANLKNAASSVFFSATLTPPDYFKSLLGAKEDTPAYTLPSPFPGENLKVIAAAGISAKYKKRELFYEDIADYIHTAVSIKPGNYFAFFPSYAYMDNVYGLFREKYADVKTSIQTPSLPEAEKESFLASFDEQDESAFVAFAVLGGMFSEGVDLPGKRLIGAFIISVGLPKLSFERLLISNYFDTRNGRGFEYSYVYPGMNKVLQAGGRVIRTTDDKGIIVLMDERFSLKQYYRLFPEGWRGFHTVRNIAAFGGAVSSFWGMEEI